MKLLYLMVEATSRRAAEKLELRRRLGQKMMPAGSEFVPRGIPFGPRATSTSRRSVSPSAFPARCRRCARRSRTWTPRSWAASSTRRCARRASRRRFHHRRGAVVDRPRADVGRPLRRRDDPALERARHRTSRQRHAGRAPVRRRRAIGLDAGGVTDAPDEALSRTEESARSSRPAAPR